MSLLVIGRKEGQSFLIGKDILVTVTKVQGKYTRVSIVAPIESDILRVEKDKDSADRASELLRESGLEPWESQKPCGT